MYMKNKLFYLFGAAFLLCSIGTFTACSDDDNVPVENEEPPVEPWELSGKYLEGTQNNLKMTYNGHELTGKKVTIKADEENKTASIELEGTEKDLGAMLYNLLDLKVTTNSPVPGEKKITLKDVALTRNERGASYSFEAEDKNPTRNTICKGTIRKGELSIDITNLLATQELAGTWNLGEIKNTAETADCKTASPLWIDWDSNVYMDLGEIDAGIGWPIEFNYPPNQIFSMLMCWLGPFINFDIEPIIANQLKDVTAEPSGSMFVTYAWDNDLTNPNRWSSDMNHNIMRYYYGKEPNQIYIEANIDFLLQALSGLIATRAAEQEELDVLLNRLSTLLKPVLENGFPCTYLIEEDNLKLTLDGVFTRDVLRCIVNILNEPTINELVMQLIDGEPSLASYKPTIQALLKALPDALYYHDGDAQKGFEGECSYINIGMYLVKPATEEETE